MPPDPTSSSWTSGCRRWTASRPPARSPRTAGCEHVRVLILTTYDTDAYVFEALQAGASGFLLKDAGPAELLHAHPGGRRRRGVARAADHPPPHRPVHRATHAATKAAEDRLAVLTQREREVLALVGQGMSNDEIGAELFLSPATARTHVSHAMVKLGARDRAQLVVIAYQTGLVSPLTGDAHPRVPQEG